MIDFEVLDNGQVLKVEQVGNAIVKTHHAMQYEVHLSADKTVIAADGLDVATITATIRDWLGQYTGEDRVILFDVNGAEVAEEAVDGVAVIEIDATVAGEIIVRSKVAGYDNGEVVINAG